MAYDDPRSPDIEEMAKARLPRVVGIDDGGLATIADMSASRAARAPDETYGDPGSGLQIPTAGQEQPEPASLRNPFDALNSALRPDSTSAQSYRSANNIPDPNRVTLAESAKQPRTPQPPSAVSEQLQSVQVPKDFRFTTIANDGSRGTVNTIPAQPNATTQLDAINNRLSIRGAQDSQVVTNMNREAQSAAARAQAGYDLGTAQNEARIANFRAQNGADMILRGGNKEQKAGILAAAGAANAKVEALRGQANAAPPNPNVIADAINSNAAIQMGQNAQTAQQGGVIQNAVEKQKLEQQTRVNQLGAVLANSKSSPAQRDQASTALLSLLGKDKPEEYQVIHAAGGQRLDGITPVKDPDHVVIVNRRTGSREVIPLSQAPREPPANHIAALKKDPALAAQFDLQYGDGAAKRVLGK